MAPSRRKGSHRAAAAAAAKRQWKIGDLVLAKMKGFPAWPAVVTEPEKWGYTSSDRKKILVYFYGTKQIAFCNYADIEAFTEEKKKTILIKRQGKGADFVRAAEEIIEIYETMHNQNLAEANLGDKGIETNAENSESSRSKSIRKSPEVTSRTTDKNQSEALAVNSESHDAADDIPMVFSDRQNTADGPDPTEEVSILDQLRQTPLSGTNTTARKRRRDESLPNSVTHKKPSVRRSRRSSNGHASKLQNSATTLDHSKMSTRDVVEEDPPDKKWTEIVVPISESCNGTANATEKDGNLEPSYKSENPVGQLDANDSLNENGRMNGKPETPCEAVIIKKKRGSLRKRVTDTPSSDTLEKEALKSELHESPSESPTSHKETKQNFSKTSGDEHLPLVKRARVRMEKQPVEEKQLQDFAGDREKLEILEPVEKLDKQPTSSSLVNVSPEDRIPMVKEVASSSPINDCTHTSGNSGIDLVLNKVNKYHLKGITVDNEAALPPSKRLHRALEAMSANAAEATNIPETTHDMKLLSNGCTDLPKSNLVQVIAAPNNLSSDRSPHIQSSDSTNVQDNTPGFSSSLISHNLEVSVIASSQVEHEDALPKALSSTHDKDLKGMLDGDRDSNGSFTSKATGTNSHEKVNQPCNVKSTEKEINSTSNDGLGCQFASPLGSEDGVNKTLKPVNEPFFLRADGCPVASKTPESVKSPGSLSDGSIQSKDVKDIVDEAKHKAAMKYWKFSSDTAPIKDLIAAAQAKRFYSRSTSFPDSVTDVKAGSNDSLSPSIVNREDLSGVGSTPITKLNHRPASDDRTHRLHDSSRSPASERETGLHKLTVHGEANVARRSFEALLCTLSRTKESISRATRVAADCAKYGIAAEAIEILLQHLERESSMYKRIDLFFLVDSIIQWSRSQKGGFGDVYFSLVQTMLPRLLSAAAPTGNGAWENRKQCLKVLRLWLERRTLSETVLRHHIRELESVSEASLAGSYSRRLPRTERALNDPIREMEGMFVDEYGSNTSFQLQNLFVPRLLEEEEGSGDDDKSFEAVTPEHDNGVNAEEITQNIGEKHRHILEDVDGELEMEDVAPQCGIEVNTVPHIAGAGNFSSNRGQLGHHEQQLSRGPPLPEELPPTPPPLPSSPPPKPSLGSTSRTLVPHKQVARPHVHIDVSDFHNNYQNHHQPVGQHSNNLHDNVASSDPVTYYNNNGYRGYREQIPPPLSHGSRDPYESHPPMHSGNNMHPAASARMANKSYCVQPPPPTVSNQFSYVHADSRQREHPPLRNSSYNDRYRYENDSREGEYYGDRNIRGPVQRDSYERGRFSSVGNRGHVRYEKTESHSNYSHPNYGPPEPSGNQRHDWSMPHRRSSYYGSSSQRPLRNPVSRVNEEPGYWRPR